MKLLHEQKLLGSQKVIQYGHTPLVYDQKHAKKKDYDQTIY